MVITRPGWTLDRAGEHNWEKDKGSGEGLRLSYSSVKDKNSLSWEERERYRGKEGGPSYLSISPSYDGIVAMKRESMKQKGIFGSLQFFFSTSLSLSVKIEVRRKRGRIGVAWEPTAHLGVGLPFCNSGGKRLGVWGQNSR